MTSRPLAAARRPRLRSTVPRIIYRRVRAWWLAGAILATAGVVVGGNDPSWTRRVLILTRALAYDRHLLDRAGEEIAVAVIYRDTDPESRAAANEILPYFKLVEKVRLAGLPFRAQSIAYSNAGDLSNTIVNDGIDAIYICPGVDALLSDLLKVTRAQKVISMTSQEAFVQAGVSMGIIVEGGEPRLMLNLPASRAEGCDFSAQLLRLATVIR